MCFVGFPGYGFYRDWLERLVLRRHFLLSEGARVLDLGCGTGRVGIAFTKKAKNVTAVDYSEELLKIGKSYCKKKAIDNIKFEKSDVTQFNDNYKYDLIFIGGVLMCLNDEDVQKTLRNAKALLAKHGKLIIRDSLAENKREVKNYYTVYRSINDLKNLMERADLVLHDEFYSYNQGLVFYGYLELYKIFAQKYKLRFILNIFAPLLYFLLALESLANIFFETWYLNLFLRLKKRKDKNIICQKTFILE